MTFFKGNIRQNQSINAKSCCFLYKLFNAMGIDHIGIGHETNWNLCVLSNSFHHFKNIICRCSCRKCPQIRLHNDRSFCCWIRKWNSKLNHICPCSFHRIHNLLCCLQIWIPTSNKWNKCLAIFKYFCNLTH